MLRKPHYIILALVVLLVLVLMRLPSGTMGKAKLAISGLFLPLFGLTGSAHDLSTRASLTVVSKTQLSRQIEDLTRENQELRLRLQQDAAVWAENARLRGLVSWPRQTFWKVRFGKVIARDPANWWRSVQIDLGTRDGIKINYTVVTPDGLVGRIQSVDYTRSQVLLLGSPDLKVAAAVEQTGETGIISASTSAPQEDGMVDLDYLPGNSKVRPGQDVVTWGQGGVFPARITIGKVFDVRARDYGLAMQARVKLAADIGALQEVFVVTP
jgi:rod shape-determining protein MreC